jgi:hypothetical protein
MQIGVDLNEAMTLVPALCRRVVASPCFEADDPQCACLALGLLEQRRRDALSLVVWMVARCQIIPPVPGRRVNPSLSHSTSSRPTILPAFSATSSIDGFS